MSSLGSASDPARIRNASLPKSLRGFDETATRKLLNEAADVLQSLTAERDQLRRQVESLQTGPRAESDSPEAIGNAVLAAKRAGEELVAEAKAEAARLLREATAEAARLLREATAEAGRFAEEARSASADVERELALQRAQIARDREELDREMRTWQEQVAGWEAQVATEREGLVAEARVESERILAANEQRLADLRYQEEELRRVIAEQRSHVIELLRSALAQLEPFTALENQAPPSADLPATLASRVADGSGLADTQATLPDTPS